MHKPQDETNETMQYLSHMFGSRAGLYSLDNERQRQQFGIWLRMLRELTPLEHVQPKEPEAATVTQLSLMSDIPQQQFRHVSRAVFLEGYRKAFRDLTNVGSPHDEKHVKRLEAGEVPLTPLIPCCASFALKADRLGAAILFEAAGCGGWDAIRSQLYEEEGNSGTSFITLIADGASGRLSRLDVATLLQAMRQKIDAEFKKRGK